jgi:hypothetical protein
MSTVTDSSIYAIQKTPLVVGYRIIVLILGWIGIWELAKYRSWFTALS